eukprot:g1127.t1
MLILSVLFELKIYSDLTSNLNLTAASSGNATKLETSTYNVGFHVLSIIITIVASSVLIHSLVNEEEEARRASFRRRAKNGGKAKTTGRGRKGGVKDIVFRDLKLVHVRE